MQTDTGRETKKWEDQVREDHQALQAQVGALEAALSIEVGTQDRRVVLSWIIRNLWPSMELHLRKEEEALFPELQRLLGKSAGALSLLRAQHAQLREGLRHLAELLQDQDNLQWNEIRVAAEAFIHLLDEHEKLEERLLLDVLRCHLKPKDLKPLAEAYRKVAETAYEEEGWPRPRRAKLAAS